VGFYIGAVPNVRRYSLARVVRKSERIVVRGSVDGRLLSVLEAARAVLPTRRQVIWPWDVTDGPGHLRTRSVTLRRRNRRFVYGRIVPMREREAVRKRGARSGGRCMADIQRGQVERE
jgi:hypothetical protein